MLTVKLKSGVTKKFNLKTFVREQAFKNAWYSMKGDDSYACKRLVGRTTTGEGFDFHIIEIEGVDFLASEYIEGKIHESTSYRR